MIGSKCEIIQLNGSRFCLYRDSSHIEVKPGWSWGRSICAFYFLVSACGLPAEIGPGKLLIVFAFAVGLLVDIFLRNRFSITKEGVRKGLFWYNKESVSGLLIKHFSVDANFPANAPALVMKLKSGREVELLKEPIFLEYDSLAKVKEYSEQLLKVE